MQVCVPASNELFEIYEVPLGDKESPEKAVIEFGRSALTKGLSVDYLWYKEGTAYCITKPINNTGYAAAALSRGLYDSRSIPADSGADESWEIFSLDLPAVAVTHHAPCADTP